MRSVKILLAAVAAVAALLVIAVAIVAWTFDPNDYKAVVTDAFTARTGRALAIEQDLRLVYFPWLAVETGGVTIGSAPDLGGAARPFARVTHLAARIKLVPLIAQRIEIGTVELEGLTLNLARDLEGRGNWRDLVEAANEAAPATAAEPTGAPRGGFTIEGVRVRDGSLYWRENTDELRYSVTRLSLTTGSIGRDEPIALDAALQFKDETSGLTADLAASAVIAAATDGTVTATAVEASATVSARDGGPPRAFAATATRIAFDRAAATLDVEGLVTEVMGISATWQLATYTFSTNPTVRGSVTVAPTELATVFEPLGLSPPATLAAGDLGTLAVATGFSFQAEPRLIALSGVSAELLGMRLTGEGSLTSADELAGHIVIDEFAPNAALQALLRAAIPPTVDVSALGTLALDVHFDTNLVSGRAALRDLTLSALGATISGNLEALPGDRGNVIRGSLAIARFSPAAMTQAFAALLPPNLATGELGMIELDTRFTLDSATDTLNVAPLRAEMFGLRATAEVTARDISRAATWTGTASVAQFSPQDLLRRFGLPAQPTSDPQAFTRATLDTRFAITKEGAELDGLVLVLDDTTITGTFALHGFDDPSYRFALDVDRVDADRYLPPKARDAQDGEATAGDIELPQNNTMNLDGTMRIGTLQLAGMEFAGVGSRILISNGDLKLENAHARLYGGTFDGNFHVHAAGSEPGLALDGRAAGIALEPLIAALTGEAPNFSGTGSFDLTLAGTGRTVIENVDTAAGNATFDIVDGAIKGFNLGRTLCSAYNFTQRAPAPAEQPLATAYEAIEGSAVVAAGTATSNDLLVRTSFMDISGAGTLQLVQQRLDYELDAKLTGPIAITGCETLDPFIGGALPFEIHGTVTEPEITPDFSKLVQRAIRDQLQDRLQDRLRDLLR